MKWSKLKGYKYKVEETERFNVDIWDVEYDGKYLALIEGVLYCKMGYAWNGPNWSFDKHSRESSLAHDAGYQLIREGVLDEEKHRDIFDQLFRDLCVQYGLWKSNANFRYFMLRNFGVGGSRQKKNPRNRIYESKKRH